MCVVEAPPPPPPPIITFCSFRENCLSHLWILLKKIFLSVVLFGAQTFTKVKVLSLICTLMSMILPSSLMCLFRGLIDVLVLNRIAVPLLCCVPGLKNSRDLDSIPTPCQET